MDGNFLVYHQETGETMEIMQCFGRATRRGPGLHVASYFRRPAASRLVVPDEMVAEKESDKEVAENDEVMMEMESSGNHEDDSAGTGDEAQSSMNGDFFVQEEMMKEDEDEKKGGVDGTYSSGAREESMMKHPGSPPSPTSGTRSNPLIPVTRQGGTGLLKPSPSSRRLRTILATREVRLLSYD